MYEGQDTQRFLRVHIVARITGFSIRTVRRRILEKKVPATRIGRRAWGIRISDLPKLTLNNGGDCD